MQDLMGNVDVTDAQFPLEGEILQESQEKASFRGHGPHGLDNLDISFGVFTNFLNPNNVNSQI